MSPEQRQKINDSIKVLQEIRDDLGRSIQRRYNESNAVDEPLRAMHGQKMRLDLILESLREI